MATATRTPAKTRAEASGGRNRRAVAPGTPRAFYWMVLPAFVPFVVFHTVPVLQGISFSFTDSPGYGTWNFVGLSNYLALFTDDRVIAAYLFTFKIGVALGIDRLSTSILADPSFAWIGILVLAVWQATAFNTILYLAGLQTVPGELYEAASIDGASPWRQFRSITFPMIAAFFTINMVLALKGFMQVFDHIIAMTNGGPGTSTESVGVLIYKGGLQGGEYGYQLANAVVFIIIIAVFAIVQLRFLQRREGAES